MRIRTRGYVGNVGHVGYLPALRVGEEDAGMIEQEAGSAIEFRARLLVSRHGRNERGLRLSQCCLILQHKRCGGSAKSILFLLGI